MRGRIARCDRGRANERAWADASAHTSDSRTFAPQFVELRLASAAVAGRLTRSPHRYRNQICRRRSGSANGTSETVNASEEITRGGAPAAHTHCAEPVIGQPIARPVGSAGTTEKVTPPLAAPSPRSSARAAHRRPGQSVGPGCSRNPSLAAAWPLLHPAPIRRPS
jgi:hypothetical protein